MLEAYHEIDKSVNDKIPYPFIIHVQKTKNNSIACNAHWHYYIELLYVLSGRANVYLNSVKYDFKKGDMVLINSRDVHSIMTADEDIEYIVIRFDPELLFTTSRTLFESKYVLPFVTNKSKHQKIFSDIEIKDTPIPSLLTDTVNEYKNKGYGFELAIRTNICRVFLYILRSWEKKGFVIEPGYTIKEKDILLLQQIFDYVDENYKYDVTAEAVAQMCNLSYSYFSRQFKVMMGKTFTEYLNYIRITEAEKLLLSTDLNITQIAIETGFSNSSYFIKQFKHFKNISPKHFRKKLLSR